MPMVLTSADLSLCSCFDSFKTMQYDHESTRSIRSVRSTDNETLKRSIRNPRPNDITGNTTTGTTATSTDVTRSMRNSPRLVGSERRTHVPAATQTKSSSKSPEGRRNDEVNIHKGPHQVLAAAGSAETVRERNVNSLLLDFFGI
jgi:hypothetical protein